MNTGELPGHLASKGAVSERMIADHFCHKLGDVFGLVHVSLQSIVLSILHKSYL